MNNKKTKLICNYVLFALELAFLLIVILRKSIFPGDSLLANLYEEDVSAQIGVRLLKTLIIVVGCAAFISISKIILMLSTKVKASSTKTMFILLGNILKYVAAIAALLMALSAWGVDTAALVTGAGVLALIVGLGCQTLVSDVVAGIFILFEGDFKIGDVVVIGGWRGTVQSIGLRTTKIIDAVGNVKILNNSAITDIVNNTKDLSVAVCDVGIEYNESIERVENVLLKNLESFKEKIPSIKDGPYYKGVASLGESSIVIRMVAQCAEEDKYQTERDINREIKLLFDKNKINIPFNQVVVNYRAEDDAPVNVSKAVSERATKFIEDQKEQSKGIDEELNN